MSRQIQLRRGTTLENDNFTGAIGELTYDTERKTVRVHDGSTPGGEELALKADVDTTIENAQTNILEKIFPNLTSSNSISVPFNQNYAFSSDGWVVGSIYFSGVGSYCTTWMDGKQILTTGTPPNATYWMTHNICIPVKVGVMIQNTSINAGFKLEVNAVYFYPVN